MRKLILIFILLLLIPLGSSAQVPDKSLGIDATADSFVSTWNTELISTGSSADNQVKLPLVSFGTYDFTVDWGDLNLDIITTYDQAEVTHTYSSVGTYNITIDGIIEVLQFKNLGDKLKLTEISQWGNFILGSGWGYFQGCQNLVITATDTLDLSGTTSFSSIFAGCDSLGSTGNLNNWDVSGVTNMVGAFASANNFNAPLGDWDTSNVYTMTNMFSGAVKFNQSIGEWDTSNVEYMNGMFSSAFSFDQDIGNWNVSKARIMNNMFDSATVFNQNIGNWDTSSVSDMHFMFSGASLFNQPIGNWNVSSVTDMEDMFYQHTSFNQDIGNWDTSSVTTMNNMFKEATSFNKPIGNWDVSNVVTMSDMFYKASSFKQPIINWNVTSVTSMDDMFWNASSFDQDISNWDVSSVEDMTNMFYGITLSTVNYDDILIKWSELSLQSGVNFHAGNSMYSYNAYNSKLTLLGTFGWIITDGGQNYKSTEPELVRASSSDMGIEITWSEPVCGDGWIIEYQIYRSTDNIDYTNIGSSIILSYLDIDVTIGNNYYYYVRSVTKSGLSEASSIVVVDMILPDINSPDDLTYVLNSIGNVITWNMGDDNPDVYEISKDGILYESGYWSNGITIVNIDGLSTGEYVFTIEVYDDSGNMISDSVTVTVIMDTASEDTTSEAASLNFSLFIVSVFTIAIIYKRKKFKIN